MTLFQERPELLVPFREGRREALELLYVRYLPEVTRVLQHGFTSGAAGQLRVPGLHDPAALRDALQEVFVRAFQERARLSFDGLRPYRPFLLRIAQHVRIDQLRKTGREAPVSSLGSDADDALLDIDALLERNLPFAGPAPVQPQEQREWERLVALAQAYTATLDAEAQHFVATRFAEGRSQSETAEIMGISRRRVRTLEDRVQAGLKRYLARR